MTKIELDNALIEGLKLGLEELEAAKVLPMGLSLAPSSGKLGWGWFKYKALPGHPAPGNAGNGWSHPAEAAPHKSAPRDWPYGGCFVDGHQCTMDEANEYVAQVVDSLALDGEYVVEHGWIDLPDGDKPGTLVEITVLWGGAEYNAHETEIPDGTKKDYTKRSRSLYKSEQDATEAYMRLAQRRIKAGLSQQSLAEETGIPVGSIRNWEQGRHIAPAEALKKIAAVVKCKIEDLI